MPARDERPRRRRSRRRGRGGGETREPQSAEAADSETSEGEVSEGEASGGLEIVEREDLFALEAPPELAASHEHAPRHVEPEAPAPVAHYYEPSVVTPAAEPESIAAKPEPVAAEPDPNRPKRSGWWQRAKASLGS